MFGFCFKVFVKSNYLQSNKLYPTRLIDSILKCGNYCILRGLKWELGFAHFLAGKMGFHALGLGFINQKTIENRNGTKI